MSSSKSPRTICLPAHILDANISPRAREVLMLLASQTTIENPTVWICHPAIAEKLRCSSVTVKRAIQKLAEAKLITETGDLHERRYKFYRVRWSMSSATPAKGAPCKGTGVKRTEGKDWMPACAGMTKKEPKSEPLERQSQVEQSAHMTMPKEDEHAPPLQLTIDQSAMLKDSRIAYWAEVARKKHEENLKRYKMDLIVLKQTDFAFWEEHCDQR